MQEQVNYQQLQEKLKIVEQELMQKHQDWPQTKANFVAKKLLCLI
ncbi:MAG TPA: hypothetical protein VJH20_05660 [Candidatus Nanoarchaeia archaeon]|nr:hypothetical protein [Candidatus Nanoarchaeia archaeon]